MAAFDFQDESGTFLTVEAEDSVDPEHAEDTIESEGHETSEDNDDDIESVSSLKQALEEMTQQKRALEDEVAGLKQDLTSSRARITELWRMSCMQVQEYDEIVTTNDNAIRELQLQLSAASVSEVQDA